MKIMLTSEYHEDYGNCLFFHFENFIEPPDVCCASALDIGFDESYWTHFTKDFDWNSAMDQAEKLNANHRQKPSDSLGSGQSS